MFFCGFFKLSRHGVRLLSFALPANFYSPGTGCHNQGQRSADILVCRIAGIPARRMLGWGRNPFRLRRRADWKVGGTADKNVCATGDVAHQN
jgi:hypothetical protein